MWAKLKCWFLGHDWKIFGMAHKNIGHEKVISQGLYYCKNCWKWKEYDCLRKYNYAETDESAVTPPSEPIAKD